MWIGDSRCKCNSAFASSNLVVPTVAPVLAQSACTNKVTKCRWPAKALDPLVHIMWESVVCGHHVCSIAIFSCIPPNANAVLSNVSDRALHGQPCWLLQPCWHIGALAGGLLALEWKDCWQAPDSTVDPFSALLTLTTPVSMYMYMYVCREFTL